MASGSGSGFAAKGYVAAAALALILCGFDAPFAAAAGVDLDFFKPTSSSTGTFCEENGLTVPAGRLDIGATAGYAHRSLLVGDQKNGSTTGAVVRDRVTSYFIAAYGITERVDVGVRLGAVVRQVGDVNVDIADNAGVPQHPSTQALGDTDLLLRVALLEADRIDKRVRLTLLAPFGIPTGRPDALAGSGNFSFRPRLIAGWHWPRLSVSGSAGFGYTRPVEVPGSALVVGKAVLGGLGLAYALVPERLWIQGEASASMGLELSQTGGGSMATQLIVGARAALPGGLLAQAGLGSGLTQTAGSPRLAAMLGLAWVWALR